MPGRKGTVGSATVSVGTMEHTILRDEDSEAWVAALSSPGPEREAASARLHEILLRAARFEVNRRRASLPPR